VATVAKEPEVLSKSRMREICLSGCVSTGESAKETVKTIAQGMPGVPVTCGD